MNLSKPNKGMVEAQDDGARLLSQLIEFYDAILELDRRASAAGTVKAVEAIVDFGLLGDTNASVIVPANWAKATSKIVASVGDDARADEAAIEEITVGVSDHAAGSFRVWAAAPSGAIGQYKVHAIGVF